MRSLVGGDLTQGLRFHPLKASSVKSFTYALDFLTAEEHNMITRPTSCCVNEMTYLTAAMFVLCAG